MTEKTQEGPDPDFSKIKSKVLPQQHSDPMLIYKIYNPTYRIQHKLEPLQR
jgi:hypothetical protein